ncbi:MAG: response regulator, partial [Bacteroidota bacterium]
LQFFTNISHEFRTPLTLISNPLKDIINDNTLVLPDQVKEKHQTIHKNTDRLSRLINELMDFRKLESNKIKVKATTLNIIAFVRDIADYFKEEALHKNIRLKVESDTSELKAWADPGMLEKIIFNLLSNAFKVTPEGGAITLHISLKTTAPDLPLTDDNTSPQAFEIAISDTGPGLKKAQIAHIFERFYQIDTLNKRYYEGTGVGLEVVRSFVTLHSGKIEVNSTLNVGTTFSVILPLGKAHFKPDEIVSVPKNKTKILKESSIYPAIKEKDNDVTINPDTPMTHKLLIVEDNTELRNYLKKELSNHYKIYTATNGNEGLRVAKEETPDIIITDVIMPEMNGFDFCIHIKKDLKTSHIPLLMLTAKTTTNDRLEGIDAGADAYMVKPFDMRVLKSRLLQLLTSRQMLFNKYFNAVSDTTINPNTTSLDKEFIQKVLHYIHEKLSDPDLNVAVLSSQLHLSRSQFYRKIKTLTGQSANQFLRNIRLQRARQMLEKGQANVSEICYTVGFSSPSYFTKCFKTHFGVLPTEIETEES